MKKVILKSITMKNFRGEKSRTTDFDADMTSIVGANGLGKSRHFDLFMWVLFGKDALGRTDYNIQTVDKDGRTADKVDTEGQVTLLVDGEEVVLKRTYKQKWVRPKGQATEVYKGHETKLEHNGTPLAKAKYKIKVNEIIDESVFQMITDPSYFVSMKWQAMREQLFAMSEALSDEDVANSHPEYVELLKQLNGKSMDEFKSEIRAAKSKVQEKLDEIQPRIDQTNELMPEAQDWDALITEAEDLQKQIDELDKQIANNPTPERQRYNKIQELQKQVDEVDQKMKVITDAETARLNQIQTGRDKTKNALQASINSLNSTKQDITKLETAEAERVKEANSGNKTILDAGIEKLDKINQQITTLSNNEDKRVRETNDSNTKKRNSVQGEINNLESSQNKVQSALNTVTSDIQKLENQIEQNNQKLTDARAEWKKTKKSTYNDGNTKCSACGAEIPADELQRRIAEFDKQKEIDLDKLVKDSDVIKKSIADDNKSITDKEQEQKTKQGEIDKLDKDITAKRKELDAIPADIVATPTTQLEGYQALYTAAADEFLKVVTSLNLGLVISDQESVATKLQNLRGVQKIPADIVATPTKELEGYQALYTAAFDVVMKVRSSLGLDIKFDDASSIDALVQLLQTEIDKIPEVVTGKGESELEGYKALSDQKTQLEADIKEWENKPIEQSTLANDKQELVDQLKDIRKKQDTKETIAEYTKTIKNLETKGTELAQEIADLERQEFTILNFIKTRIEECEKRINAHFTMVTFKMFDLTLEGNEVEVCVPMVNGVSYGSVNTAAQINAGLDIINALCKFYDVCAPIFIDGRESVNEIIPTESQIINLIVTEDKELIIK